jgi:hypothetical protein
MSFSNNINLLLSDPTITPKMIVNQIKQKLSSNNINELNTPVNETTKTPEYQSPQYIDDDSEPVYLPDTPGVSPSSSMYYDPNGPQTPSMSPPDDNGPQTPSMSPPDYNNNNNYAQSAGSSSEPYDNLIIGSDVMYRGIFHTIRSIY